MDYKDRQVKIAGVVRESIVDGPGIRFVVFAQGCCHNCEGCHNQDTHDFEGGYWCDFDKIIGAINKNPMVTGVTFSGGEPFLQAKAFAELAAELKKLISVDKVISIEGDTRRIIRKERPRNLHLLSYTGFTVEDLISKAKNNSEGKYLVELLKSVDALIDGPFNIEEKDLTLEFRGSRNQRYLEREDLIKKCHL